MRAQGVVRFGSAALCRPVFLLQLSGRQQLGRHAHDRFAKMTPGTKIAVSKSWAIENEIWTHKGEPMEQEILQLLKLTLGARFSYKEVGRIVNRRRYRDDFHWARPVLEQLVYEGSIMKEGTLY